MSSIRAGLAAAAYTWKTAGLPLDEAGWDSYDARMLRYWFNEAYHQNIIYDSLNSYAEQIKANRKLYHAIRGIYNPVARQTGIYVSKCYPGMLDMDQMSKGAIPIIADDAIKQAVKLLWMESNWGSEKNLFVRHGAKYGDSFIKLVDNPSRGKVRMEVLDPRYVKHTEKDGSGNIVELHIEYERVDKDRILTPLQTGVSNDTQTYTYTEVVTPDSFATFKDGDPFAFYENANGELVPGWENIYGFVPVVHAKHKDEGLLYGATAYNEFTGKIDEINDAASVTNDSIRKHVNPPWYFAGVSGPDQLDAKAKDSEGKTQKDAFAAIYGPLESQPYAMVADINIADASANIMNMLAELEADMPELALHRMRQQLGNISGIAITSLYDDAASRITEAQSNYDEPLIHAHQMAMSIGAIRNYDGYRAFSPRSFETGAIEMSIGARPPLRDTLSKIERMNLLVTTNAPAPMIWTELGYGSDEIENWIRYAASSPEAAEAEVARLVEAFA